MKRKELDFVTSPPALPQRPVPTTSGSNPALALASLSAKERLLRVPAGKLGLLVKCMVKVCSDRVLEAIMEEFEAMEAEEQRRSLTSRLPEELLCDVLEFTMGNAKEIGPLSLVSKAFGHCVKLPQMLERVCQVTLRVPDDMLEDVYLDNDEDDESDEENAELDEEAMDEKRALLEVYLRQAGEQYPGLGRLDMCSEEDVYNSLVQNDSMAIVASMFPALKSLRLIRCTEVSDVNSLSSLTSLTELTLVDCSSPADSGIQSLARLTAMRRLILDNSHITHAGPLASMTGLEELNLSNCHELTDEGLRPLSSLRRLQNLSLQGNEQLTGDGLQFLPACLARLDLEFCRGLTEASLEGLPRLMPLQELMVSYTNIGDADVHALGSLVPSLTKLDLHSCKSITDAGFSSLSSLSSLQDLNVNSTNIGDAGIRAVSSLPSLTKLDLGSCKSITDAGFSSLSSLSSLQNLDVAWTNIGDAGIRAVSSLPSLTKLDLHSCMSITDARFSSLSSLSSLEELDARVTNIGLEAVRTLRTVLSPSIRILWSLLVTS